MGSNISKRKFIYNGKQYKLKIRHCTKSNMFDIRVSMPTATNYFDDHLDMFEAFFRNYEILHSIMDQSTGKLIDKNHVNNKIFSVVIKELCHGASFWTQIYVGNNMSNTNNLSAIKEAATYVKLNMPEDWSYVQREFRVFVLV